MLFNKHIPQIYTARGAGELKKKNYPVKAMLDGQTK